MMLQVREEMACGKMDTSNDAVNSTVIEATARKRTRHSESHPRRPLHSMIGNHSFGRVRVQDVITGM
jgi:hypothetical protein